MTNQRIKRIKHFAGKEIDMTNEKVADLVRDAFYEGCRDMQSWNGTLGPMNEDEIFASWKESESRKQLLEVTEPASHIEEVHPLKAEGPGSIPGAGVSLDPVSGLDRRAQEAAWRAGAQAILEHAPDMGPIPRTALMQVVAEAAIKAYIAALTHPE